jgi:hypothetical protein
MLADGACHAALDGAAEVGQDVGEEVRGDDDVEGFGLVTKRAAMASTR